MVSAWTKPPPPSQSSERCSIVAQVASIVVHLYSPIIVLSYACRCLWYGGVGVTDWPTPLMLVVASLSEVGHVDEVESAIDASLIATYVHESAIVR
jgi:hypothetical protein